MPAPHIGLILCDRRKVQALVISGKIKLVMVTKAIFVPNGGKPGTHGCEPGINGFDKLRVISEMDTCLAAKPAGT